MSRAGVGRVIEQLVTDEALRIRFAFDRVETLAELLRRRFDLSPDELDLFCRTDAALWFLGDTLTEESSHETSAVTCGCAVG